MEKQQIIDDIKYNSNFVENKPSQNERSNKEQGGGKSILPIYEPISQGEFRAQNEETRRTEVLETELGRRSEENVRNARKNSQEISERELIDILNKTTEAYAQETGIWIPLRNIADLGTPGPSGYENDVFLNPESRFIYKVNNLLYNEGNILTLFESTLLHNKLFPETAYEIVGFSGFTGGAVYPILKQRYIANVTEASPEQILSFMQSIGFKKITNSKHTNGVVTVSDLLPRNVLVDADGDIYVIDDNVKWNVADNNAKQQFSSNSLMPESEKIISHNE